MLVLHASLREDGLEVWAESPVGETPPARLRRRGRVPRSPGSPYDPPAEALLAALTAAGLGGELETHPAVAWLPTVDDLRRRYEDLSKRATDLRSYL